MAVGLSSSLYSVHVHVDSSSTLLSNFKHDCKTVGIPYASARRKWGGIYLLGPDWQVSGPQTKGVRVTNVPWDHLSGPQTYINNVECKK